MSKLLLEANHLRKSFGQRLLLDLEHLAVYDGDRIGLIGENGAGKTTLMKLLSGETEADEGSLRRMGSLSMIHQQGNEDNGTADRHMQALFSAKSGKSGLSGGEMTRNRIAAALSEHPQLLLADEPTTDLDGEGQQLLRKQLQAFQGALILISHDRSLLRQVCRRIWYLEDGKITVFPGGYDAFMAERSRRRERQQFEYEQYRAEQKRLRASAQRMSEMASSVRKAPARMGNGEARLHKREWTDAVLQISHAKRTLQNRMEHLEVKEKPRELPEISMQFGTASPVEARYAMKAQCGRLSVGNKTLLNQTDLILPTGSRTALMGPNGCGKSTLLRALTDQSNTPVCFDGTVQLNPSVKIGFFDQHHERTLDPSKTVLENAMAASIYPESQTRTVLIRMNFKREELFKPVSQLSGGECAKAALAGLLLMDINLLILDEPTNHLDLFAMEALERLLSDYAGTLLFVSHDEEFIRKTADRIVRFDRQRLIPFEGTLSELAAAQQKEPNEEDRRIAITTLEMRLAALSARLAAPRKGDRPETLQAEYMQLAEQLRLLKQTGVS